jgi:hypothetical protein
MTLTSLLLTLACGSSSLDVEATDDPAGTNQEEEVVEDEPATEQWAGGWVGELAIESTRGGFDCDGEVDVEFEDDGSFEGDGNCNFGDWGGDADVRIEGEIDEDGELSGSVWLELEDSGTEIELEMDGEARDEDDIDAYLSGQYTYESSWGDYEMELEGELELELD